MNQSFSQDMDNIVMQVRVPQEVQFKLFREILAQGELPNNRNMISLIKVFRAEMQAYYPPSMRLGLKEAKDYCDEILRRMNNWTERTI